MYTIPVVRIDNPELEKWLRDRSFARGVTVSSTVREALIKLMDEENAKRAEFKKKMEGAKNDKA